MRIKIFSRIIMMKWYSSSVIQHLSEVSYILVHKHTLVKEEKNPKIITDSSIVIQKRKCNSEMKQKKTTRRKFSLKIKCYVFMTLIHDIHAMPCMFYGIQIFP